MLPSFWPTLRPLALTAHCLCALLLGLAAAPMCYATTGTGPTITNATITPATLPIAGGFITVTANIADPAGHAITAVAATVTVAGNSVDVEYGHIQGGQSATLTLSNGGSGNVYTGNISSVGLNTDISAYTYTATIIATNDLSLSTSATATGRTVQANDNTPPTIANASITPTALPYTGGAITVSANITDPNGRTITAVNTTVTLTGDDSHTSLGGITDGKTLTVPLSSGGSGLYTGSISSAVVNTDIAPYTYTATITATNDLGLKNTATATGHTLQLNDGPVPQTSHTHLLWQYSSGLVSLWSFGSDHTMTHKEYGPFAGWTAKAVSDGPDGIAHILWSHSPDGQVALWDIGSSGVPVGTTYGPFAGWTATDISSGP